MKSQNDLSITGTITANAGDVGTDGGKIVLSAPNGDLKVVGNVTANGGQEGSGGSRLLAESGSWVIIRCTRFRSTQIRRRAAVAGRWDRAEIHGSSRRLSPRARRFP